MAEVKDCISVRVFETLYVLQSVHGEVVFAGRLDIEGFT